MSEEILKISTLVEQPTEGVEIDGEFYHYANFRAFSPMERSIINERWKSVVDVVSSSKRLTKAQEKTYSESMTELLSIILPGLPEAQHGRILADDKEAIVMDFLTKSNKATNARIRPMVQGLIGAKPSLLSKDSTGAPRKAG